MSSLPLKPVYYSLAQYAQLHNATVLIPTSSDAKKGAIKRAVDLSALSIAIRELQMCVPVGTWQDYQAQGQAVKSEVVQEFFKAKGFDVQV